MISRIGKEWDFDIFKFNQLTEGRPLYFAGQALFRAHNLIQKFSIDERKLHNFLKLVEDGYHKDNPYHNNIHAADVAITLDFLVRSIGLDFYILLFYFLVGNFP